MNGELKGTSIIGRSRGDKTAETFRAFDPATGSEVEPAFYSAALGELERAATLAEAARIPFGNISGRDRAGLLRDLARVFVENDCALKSGKAPIKSSRWWAGYERHDAGGVRLWGAAG